MLVKLTRDISVYFERKGEICFSGVWYEGKVVNIDSPRKREVRVNPSDENTTRLFVVPMRIVGDGGVVYALKSELFGRYKKV